MLFINRAQWNQMSKPMLDKQRDNIILEMQAIWDLFSPRWDRHFVKFLTYQQRKVFFGQTYDWCITVPIIEKSNLLSVALLLTRAVYQGWEQVDMNMAMRQIDINPDHIDQVLFWLDYVLDEE